MTDINHLPNGYDLPENRMTREEWKHYFECREKYDVKYSKNDVKKLFQQMDEFFDKGDYDTFDKITRMIPLDPEFAIGIKRTDGLKILVHANLSWAKEVYPDEF